MTIAMLNTENINTIYWDAVAFTEVFTPKQSGGALRTSRRPPWAAWPKPSMPTRNIANDDIAAGRLKRFQNVDDMLASLRAK